MKRRTFSATSLASFLAPLPSISHAFQANHDTPGYQFAEIVDGRLTTRHKGMATEHTAVDDDTLFQAASCSKTVTALAILTLVRDGRMDLDQPASRYLQRWQMPGPRGMTATVGQLMSHTAGTSVHGFDGYGLDENIPTLLDILAGKEPANSGAVRTRRRLFSEFSYSGGGTMVLQTLIEDLTGMDFATYTAAEVLNPIGANRATFALVPTTAIAHGSYENGAPLIGGFRRHPESAAAGLWASASDLAKVLQAVLRSLSGARDALLPAQLALRMVTPMVWRSGLGVFVSPSATVYHEGRNHGFDSVMAVELKTGRIRAAVANRNGALESLTRRMLPD